MYFNQVKLHLLSRYVPLTKSQRYFKRHPGIELNKPKPRQVDYVMSDISVNKNRKPNIKFPPIKDLSLAARKRAKREEWHNKIKRLTSIEEKIFELNMPKYYGWRTYIFKEGELPYDPLPHAQYLTRTHLVSEPKLPSYYDNILSPESLDGFVQQMKSQVEDAIAFEYNYRNWDYQYSKVEMENKSFVENVIAKAMTQHINRIISINLSPTYPHLLEAQIDTDPRIEAFWFFGGLEPATNVVKARAGSAWAKEWKNDPVNDCMSYSGKPILQLRHSLPLKEIISLDDSEESTLMIPVRYTEPKKHGHLQTRKRATIIPGFWPGDANEFGLISYHNRGYLATRQSTFNDESDALIAQAIYGSYAWLYGQACYQGFSTFHDPTYPLVNQMVITNGQWWSFCVYQLNTTRMHIDAFKENTKKNMCWMTEPIKLFDSVDNGKVQGINEDVLKHLIKFYANVPEVREGINMKPYLGNEKVIADIEHDERRVWLEKHYKNLMTNRPRHLLAPEIYHWQKIYMIAYNTRPLQKKTDPWQFGINPYARRLDDHAPVYIPRFKRVHRREKFAKNYYPTVKEEKTDYY